MPASVVIPAYRAADTIERTVRAVREIPGVSEVIVVDDGSHDATAEVARAAGADRVIEMPENRGKGAALDAGVGAATADYILLIDADLGDSARCAGPLLDAVERKPCMAVAALASAPVLGGGGFGLAVGLARAGIRLLTGLRVAAPMSGQRALPTALVRHVGLAPRFAVEVALTVEAAHLRTPLQEICLPIEHRRTGRTLSGFLHRGRQFRDVLTYLLSAGYGLGWPSLSRASTTARVLIWLSALVAFIVLSGALIPGAPSALTLAAGAAMLAWLPVLWVTAVWLGLRKTNHLGRSLPGGAGLLFAVVGIPGLWALPAEPPVRAAGSVVIAVLAAVGLVDDLVAGGHRARGLRGHLLALLRGRLTTGVVKAVGGLGAGLAAGYLLHPGRPALVALDALLVALSANFVNLLDLRPGRALKGFGLLCAAAIALDVQSLRLLGPLLGAAIVAAPSDFAGRTMMGDIGSNVLGGAAGLALATALGPLESLAAVLLLVAVHLACEQTSLTDVIADNRVLSWIDRLGTTHLAPFLATRPEET